MIAAAGDLVGNWSWTVWLLVPLVIVAALVTALVLGPLGDPPRARTSGRLGRPLRYADAGGPNQVVSASASPGSAASATHATYPSGRINTAVGAATRPSAGSSHGPA